MFALLPICLKRAIRPSLAFRCTLLRRIASVGTLLSITLSVIAPTVQAAPAAPACGFAEVVGIVTASDSGLPVPDVDVSAFGAEVRASSDTDASGMYTLTLPVYRDAGPYQIGFEPASNSPYLTLAPKSTQVISGATTTLNAVLPRGGTIIGQVKTADTDQPMVGVRIRASGRVLLEDNDPMVASTDSDDEGRYLINGLISGDYVLRYGTHDIASSPAITPYVTGFVGGGSYLAEATAFSVTAPNTTTINFTIALGARLAGEVRRSDSNALLEDIPITLYLLNEEGTGRGDLIQSMTTDSAGIYEFKGLAPGKYLILARPIKSLLGPLLPNADLKPEWYSNAMTSADATAVEIPEISSAQTVSVNLMLEPGATITGVVTDAESGAGIAGVGVEVRPAFGAGEVSRVVFEIKTDASGQYTLPGIYAGTYGIHYDATFVGYPTTGITSTHTGITLTVAETEVYSNVNFSLQRGGRIEGVITNAQGDPLVGVEVRLISPTNERVFRTTTTNASGQYSFSSIKPGSYHVKYDRFDPCGCYNNEFFNEGDAEEKSLIPVEADETTTGINTSLACNAPPPPAQSQLETFLPGIRP